jgi:WD40 repeat protein
MKIRRVILSSLIVALFALLTLERQDSSQAHISLHPDSCLETKQQVFRGHTNEVFSVAFSPDSRYALTGSNDWTARLWNVQTGRAVPTLTGHAGGSPASVFFSPDGRYILTGRRDATALGFRPVSRLMPLTALGR